ncbi:MAG: response regulator [Ktedonobacterales bacterium]
MPSSPTSPFNPFSVPEDPTAAGSQGLNDANSAWGRPAMRHMPPIMVIDDALVVRRVIESSFARVGIPTVSYPDGISAIRALDKHDIPTPDLILLDIGLPKMSGYEIAQLLREHPEYERTQIVMLSGRDGMVDRVRSRLVGARDFVAKPFKPVDLVARVCKLLGMDVVAAKPNRLDHPH